jgi:hypothetical protein
MYTDFDFSELIWINAGAFFQPDPGGAIASHDALNAPSQAVIVLTG